MVPGPMPPPQEADGTGARGDMAHAGPKPAFNWGWADGRLKRRRDFLAANAGVRVPTPAFILLVNPSPTGEARVGFTVSKRVGNSVARNRARRRLREVARALFREHAVPGADHVFIARPLPEERPFPILMDDVRAALGKAARRAAAPRPGGGRRG